MNDWLRWLIIIGVPLLGLLWLTVLILIIVKLFQAINSYIKNRNKKAFENKPNDNKNCNDN